MTNGNLPDTLRRAENFAFDLFRKLHPETRFKPWYIEVYQEAADKLASCQQIEKSLQAKGFESVAALLAAYEQVKTEKDAAVEDMRGICYLCKNGKPTNIGLRTLKTCEHFGERYTAARNKLKNCPHFEWKGPQKEGQ